MREKITPTSFDFELIRTEGYLYVDKTEYIYRLVKDRLNNFYFISRPRRFGKSLALSTLAALFRGRRELFDGLYIAGTDYAFEKRPVLHFDFSQLGTDSFEDFQKDFGLMIQRQAAANGVEVDLERPHAMLSAYLDRQWSETVILIDEFDAPVTACIGSIDPLQKTKRITEALSSFYSVVKGKSAHIRFLFITGVTKLSNLSVFSKMNNLVDLTFDRDSAAMFGYTEKELEECFASAVDDVLSRPACGFAGRTALLEALKEYYDGYCFSNLGGEKVYNPFSIASFFCSGGVINYYWEYSGVSLLAVELARRHKLSNMVTGPVLAGMKAFTSFDISSLLTGKLKDNAVYALLYYTGYLTCISGDKDGMMLDFPNKEIRTSFVQNLAMQYATDSSEVDTLGYKAKLALRQGDVDAMVDCMKAYFEEIPYTLLDPKDPERSYQLVAYLFFLSLGGLRLGDGPGGRVVAEDVSLRGRADVVVEEGRHVYIIEFKVDGSAYEALSQIRLRGYGEKYASLGGLDVQLVGISFSSATRRIEEFVSAPL